MKDWIWHVSGKDVDKYAGERWFCSAKRSMYYELFFVDDDEESVDEQRGVYCE